MADQATAAVAGSRQWKLALRLQAALLHLDLRVREIPEARAGEVPEHEAKADAAKVASALREVGVTFWNLKEDGTAGLRGVPAWLGPVGDAAHTATGHPAGLALLQERLESSTPVWQQIRGGLADERVEFLLRKLVEQWPMLRQVGPLPGEEVLQAPSAAPEPGIAVVFPLVHTTGNGFLVEMVLHPRAAAEPAFDTRHEQTKKFNSGLTEGRRAALGLAEELGAPRESLDVWEACDPVFHGIPPPVRLDDTSASVAAAVALVRHLLDLPDTNRLVTGEIRADGVVGSLPTEEHLTAKEQAAQDHGLGLLPLESGWKLAEVCSRLWPDSWDDVTAGTAQRGLGNLDHEVRVVTGAQTGTAPDTFTLVRLGVVDDILVRISAGAPAIVVGGPRSSARTTAARQAALAWQEMHQTPVIEVRLKDGILPQQTELEQVITLARHATQVRSGVPAVVIFEDLLPYEDAVDLDAVLTPTAERTCSTIIAVCLYSGGTRWKTDEVATVPSLSRGRDVRAFSEEFARLNGLGLDDSQLSLARRAADGDIWWLVRLLLHKHVPSPVPDNDRGEALARAATAVTERTEEDGAPQPSRESDAIAAVRKAYVRRLRAGASAGQLNQIRAVAAASLLRIAVPETLLGTVPSSLLVRLGARRDRMDRWSIARSAPCRALLASDEGITDLSGQKWRQPADAQYQALAALLRPHLRTYDPAVTKFITALLTAARAMEPGLHPRLLNLVAPALSRIEQDAPAVLAAHAILAIGLEAPVEDEDRQRLFKVLIRSISAARWHTMSARQATTCLSAIRSYRDFADETVRPGYQEVLKQIEPGMKKVLARSDPARGVLFVHELGRLWDETTMKQIIPLAVAATNRCDAKQVEHYQAVVGLIDAALKYSDGRGEAAVTAFARAPGVRRLRNADTRHDAGLILAQAALRLLLSPTDAAADNYRQLGAAVTAALRKSKPTSVTAGLTLMERTDVRTGRRIIQASKMDAWLKTALRRDAPQTPWQVAALIRTLGKVDSRSVLTVLYPGDDPAADPEIVGALADRVVRMGDLKAVGHMVSAVTSVDAFWGPGGADNAAARLCAQLEGFIDEALKDETRGSVVLAVITALVQANIPPDTLRSLLGRCADVVVTEAEGNEKDHAPRLALLLGRQEAVGPEFLEVLASRIEDTLLIYRMTHSPSVETRAAYMDLARALRRTTDEDFRRSALHWLEDSKPALRAGSVLRSLKALHAYTHLLHDVGTAFSEEKVVRDVDEEPKGWAERLKLLYHPGHLSEALHLLHHLAPSLAVDCLHELDTLLRPEARYGGVLRAAPTPGPETTCPQQAPIPPTPSPASIVDLEQRKRVRGLLDLAERRSIRPDDAVRLIHAVRTIDEEAGASIGAALSARDRWKRRVHAALLDTETPVYLGDQLQLMAQTQLALPPSLRDRLFRRWSAAADDYRSPAVVESLICGFAASGSDGVQQAKQLANKLNLNRIALRLGRGLPRDMINAPALIRTLDVWGPQGSAEQIAAALPIDAVALVDTSSAVHLLLTLLDIHPDLDWIADELEAAVQAVSAQSRLHYVPDPEVHWRELGWLIRITRAAGGDVPDPDAILDRVKADCRAPEVVAWVAGCLGRFPHPGSWFPDDVPTPPWAEAARLLVHSELAPPDSPLPSELSALLPRVSLRWQIHLVRHAAHDVRLRSALTHDDLTRLDYLGHRHLEVGRPSGAVLLRAIADLAR